MKMFEMKRMFVGVGLALALFALSGCRNTAIVYDEAGASVAGSHASGRYAIVSSEVKREKAKPDQETYSVLGQNKGRRTDGEILADWLAAESPDALVFRPDPKQVSIPAKVSVEVSDEESVGFCGILNNVLSICTLNIWPSYSAVTYHYKVVATFPGDRKEQVDCSFEEHRLSSWLPFGKIPVPAWADARNANIHEVEESFLHDVVLSCFADK